MSEWTSRPRTTPMAGRRKPTHRWCDACLTLHRTHRHALGEETCAAIEQARAARRERHAAGPVIAKPKAPRKKVQMKFGAPA